MRSRVSPRRARTRAVGPRPNAPSPDAAPDSLLPRHRRNPQLLADGTRGPRRDLSMPGDGRLRAVPWVQPNVVAAPVSGTVAGEMLFEVAAFHPAAAELTPRAP